MDQTTNELRQDIDATRDAMTDKLAQIEDRFKGTVDDLKDSVTDTVDQVKQAFDLQQQVNDRPWTMLGASVLAGYVLGSMGGDGGSSSQGYEASKYRYTPQTSYASQSNASSSASDSDKKWDQQTAAAYSGSYNNKAQSSQPGFMSDVMDQFRDELDTLKGAAVVTVTNMLRDMLKKNLPQFAEEFERARSERDQQLQDDASTNRSYQSSTSDIGTDRDATYQTHSNPPIYNATSDSASYTSGTTDNNLTRNSL